MNYKTVTKKVTISSNVMDSLSEGARRYGQSLDQYINVVLTRQAESIDSVFSLEEINEIERVIQEYELNGPAGIIKKDEDIEKHLMAILDEDDEK